MQQSASKRNWRTRLSLFVVLAYLVGLLSPAIASAKPVVAQPLAPQADVVIAEYGFEDGTTQGWYGRGAALVVSHPLCPACCSITQKFWRLRPRMVSWARAAWLRSTSTCVSQALRG